jgi:hypothetical protein
MATTSSGSCAVKAHRQPTVATASEPSAGPATLGMTQARLPRTITLGRCGSSYRAASPLTAIAPSAAAPAPSKNRAATSTVIRSASPAPSAPQVKTSAPAGTTTRAPQRSSSRTASGAAPMPAIAATESARP